MNQQTGPFYPTPQGTVQYTYPTPYPAHPQPGPLYGYPPPNAALPPGSLGPGQQPPSYFRHFPQDPVQSQRTVPVNQIGPPRASQPPRARPSSSRPNVTSPPANSPGTGPGAPLPDVNEPSDEEEGNDTRDGQSQTRDGPDDGNEDEGDVGGEENGPIFHIPPPPEDTHLSEVDLEQAIHAWSLEHGYELVKRASKRNGQGAIYKRYYHCSKHGARSSSKITPETRKRANRSSNRLGCPMSIATVAVDPAFSDGPWQVRHRKSHHNHGPLDKLKLAGHRRRARMGGVEKAVDGLFAIGSTTAQVLQFLHKTQPNGLFTRTDVGNMKIKWKKYGSCAERTTRPTTRRPPGDLNMACTSCRQKHQACGKERPVCRECADSGSRCIYEGGGGQTQNVEEDAPGDDTVMSNDPGGFEAIVSQPASTARRPRRSRQSIEDAEAQAARTQEILNSLQTFQQGHVMPPKLHLYSSSVEVLAHSTSGSGTSYRNITILYQEKDWPSFRDAMIEAARRENHHDVLTGDKREPVPPPEPSPASTIAEMEAWNEYIKQLAIFTRRNALLLAELSSKLAPHFRNRTHHLRLAADVWAVLEELCLPRGSSQAYALYAQLHGTTLAGCANDLNDYIGRLEAAYAQFRLLKVNHSPSATSLGSVAAAATEAARRPRSTGEDVLPDESLCLLFLRNLGPAWSRWAEGLLATNNIAGFGTGQRVGFRDVCRRAVAYQAAQRQSLEG